MRHGRVKVVLWWPIARGTGRAVPEGGRRGTEKKTAGCQGLWESANAEANSN